MPRLQYSRSVAAGASDLPISALGWQYEFLPWPAEVVIMQRATAAGMKETVSSGSEVIAEEQDMQAGGTAGVTPSPLNTTPLSFVAAAGDRLKVVNRNTSAGAITVDGLILVNPLI
jgi:hypothetical protein